MVDVLAGVGSGLFGAFKGVSQAIPYIMGLLIVVGISIWYYFDKKYNKRVVLFKIVGDGFRLISDRAKLQKDRDGVPFWRLKALRQRPDVPPDNCLIGGPKGETAFGYITSMGEVTWAAPEYNPGKIQRIINEKGESALDADQVRLHEFMKTFRPVTTTQRASLAYQLERAKLEQKHDWKENIPIIVSGIVLLLVLAIFMLFFGKVMEPIIAAASVVNSYEEIHLNELKILNQINGGVQELTGKNGVPYDQGSANLSEIPK